MARRLHRQLYPYCQGDEIMTHALGNKTYRNILIAAIVGLGVALSIFISALSYQADKNLMRAQFTEATENRYAALKRELENNLDALESLQALYYHSEKDVDVTRSEFRNFTGHILKQRINIQALEWSPRVPASRRKAYEKAAREDGLPDFQITERIAQGKMKRAERRKEYFPVYFVEPHKGNEIALGFDLASNPKRLEALEAAGKTGKMLATARITLVQEKENQFGFIVFAPVYSKRALLNSDRARADALEGFALGVFRIGEIVEKSMSYLKPEGVDFLIYDAAAPEKERFLYTHESRTRKTPLLNKEQPETGLRDTKTLDVAGRKWQITYSATPDFIAARNSRRPWVILFAGLALTGLVAGFLFSSARHAERAERAGEAIEASEKKLKALFNIVNDAIMIVEPSGRILDVNNVACERLGYSRDEVLKMTPRDFDTPEYAAKVAERLAEVSRKGSAIFETAWVTHDGRIIPTEISARAIEYDGKPAFLSVARDITERKQAEKTLQALTLRHTATLAAVPDIIMEVDNNKVYVWANKAGYEFFGDDVIGKEAAFYFEGEQQTYKIVQPLFDGSEEILHIESWQRRKDGEKRLLAWWCRMLKDAEGRVIGVLSTARDVTEHNKAEEALKKSEEFNRSILESVDEGFIVIDRDYRVVSAIRAFIEQTGMDLGDMTGKHCFEISHHCMAPCYKEGEMCAVKQVFDTGESRAVIHTHHDVKGTAIYVETKAYPLTKDESGKVLTVIEIIVDVTEKKKLEAQLRHAQKMEAVGTLAGGVAHDFNNILNVIIGYGVMLLDRLGDDALSKEQLNEVLSAADRAANLTKRLLTFSRKQVMEVKPVNVNELILGMDKMLSRIIGEDIVFAMELASRKIIVLADSGQIEQVLMNLISNARYVMPKGGRLTISTGTKEMDDAYITAYGYGKPGTYALISVTDTGSGMDAETQKKIFEPFFTTKGIGEGTGLGLSIVYGIIKQHDGYINVYSEPGAGTVFKIYLPLIEEETAKGQEVEAVAPGKGGTETILIAEDDAALRKLSRIILESGGYTVITAEDGEEAITKYIENRDKIQLVILDMIMPKKNGKEAYKEIRMIRPDVRALFISGYTADVINKKELLDLGMEFILKPVSTKDLLGKVREALDK